jgi:hypothetical protein
LDDKPTGRPENAHRDPRLEKAEGETVRDERVLNPSESAYESAVQGALEQFRSSPLFKHDTENNRYDKLLEQAFKPDTSIYGNVKEEGEKKTTLKEQQTRQFRGSIIQEIVTDLKRYAEMTDEKEPWWQESIPFLMGLVFKVEVSDGAQFPEWLLNNPDGKANNPGIWQRTTLDDSGAEPPDEDFKKVTTFNVKVCSFEEQPPQFDQVRQYADANTIAVAWDLNWPHAEKISALQEEAQKEPEQHLLHYRVERRALDSKEADVVNTISPVKILHREKSVLTALKPRFQVVDHFSHETLADQAALPVTGLRYLYNITPVDFAGGTGRPLTLIATRYPNTPPLVPVDAKLVVTYELAPPPSEMEKEIKGTESSKKENELVPVLLSPKQQVEVFWTEPQVAAMNSPAISKYELIFRRSDTMPIGSYGLDSSSQGPRTKSLPASNARPLPGDIVAPLEVFGPRTARQANISVDTLIKKNIYPSKTIRKDEDSGGEETLWVWRPESWRIFIRTVSINEIPSAIVPVQISLQARSIGEESEKTTEREPEERQPAELEWLPKRIDLPFLPPEDEGAVTGNAFFPMPMIPVEEEGEAFRLDDAFRFKRGEKTIRHQRHPAGFRCIRFQWNQGPSQKKAYPLDMNAGYKLLQLDIDTHTTETFKNENLLAQALRPIQDVQMTEADDLWLTPDNTLSPSQWEAWYPSNILRRPGVNEANPAESDTALKPWYSWRESILVWPEFPEDIESKERAESGGGAVLHPFLQGIVEALEDNPLDIAELETYTVDVQALPATLPTTAINFFENLTDAKTDPYGWSALQRMGLSVTFSLRKKSTSVGFSEEDNQLVTEQKMLNAVYGVFEGYSDSLWIEVTSVVTKTNPDDEHPNSIPDQLEFALNSKEINIEFTVTAGSAEKQWNLKGNNDKEYLIRRNDNRLIVYQKVPFGGKEHEHVHVELLFQPGKAVHLEEGDVDNPDNPNGLLALMQLSLRPTIKQVLRYAKMKIIGPAGAEAQIVFTGKNKKHIDLVLQSFPSDNSSSGGQSRSQFTVEPKKENIYRFTIPLNGETTILLRGGKEDIDLLFEEIKEGEDREKEEFLQLWFALKLTLPSDIAGVSDKLREEYFEINGYVKVTSLLDADRTLILGVLKGGRDKSLMSLTSTAVTSVKVEVTDNEWASYFTVPKVIDEYFALENNGTYNRWSDFGKYLTALNSKESKEEKIKIPTFEDGKGSKDQKELLAELKPAFLIWSQRFFDAGGQVDKDTLQTGEGPWLATAYPRSGTPAYVTPDAQGRLTYDHLIQDRWAHNYRYYIKPYGRYDLLWRSFEESSLLWTDEQRQDFRQQRDKTETAGLDYESAALDVVLDRTYPIDKPLVISSRRLDFIRKGENKDEEGGGEKKDKARAKQPGTTWEVIIAKHWEQSLIERNQTLVRQLSFRQIAFTLVRRFAYQKQHFEVFKEYFNSYRKDGEWKIDNHKASYNLIVDTPSKLPEKPESVDLETVEEEGNEPLKESLALPKRLGRFQQGALVVQMEGLPYYYEHKMILVAQTTTGVSPRNTITQRDFEYQSPLPLVITPHSVNPVRSVPAVEAYWKKEGQELKMEVTLRLARYWDCLPESAQLHWPDEDANVSLKPANGAMKTSALPDLDVVYQIVETFSGNVEVQEEIFFDQEAGKFKRLRLGRRFKENLNITTNSLPEEDKTSHLTLQFTLQAADGTTFEPATITSEPLSVTSVEIPVELANEISFNPVDQRITCTEFLTGNQPKELMNLFVGSDDEENDQKIIQNLLNKNVNTMRGRTLEVRARRGAATPVSEAFQAIDVMSSQIDGEG